MVSGLQRAVHKVPLVLLSLLVALALFGVYRGKFWKLLHATPYDRTWTLADDWQVSIGGWRTSRRQETPQYRTVKVSLPFAAAPLGCEFLYGAVVQDLSSQSPLVAQRLIEQPRYLIKFEYDLKNGRCESKDLSLLASDLPTTFHVQLIDVSRNEGLLKESPRALGIQVTAGDPSLRDASATIVPIPQSAPFRSSSSITENPSFSLNLRPEDFDVLISPYDNPKQAILEAIDRAITECAESSRCKRIRGAVAEISDADIIKRLSDARAAGLEVDLVMNMREQQASSEITLLEQGVFRTTRQPFEGPSPWMWLRRNPHRLSLKLPMHTKFIIVGDDLVISSNANFSFMFMAKSREVTTVYRSRAVVQLFDEVLALIRTSLYRPLAVNLADNFMLLLNADRPRRYSAGFSKPFVAIRTNEGVQSSAYGIVLKLLEKTPGQTTLAMSPLADICANYEHRRCLLEVLAEKARSGSLDILLNGHFYLNYQALADAGWLLTSKDYTASLEPSYAAIRSLFPEEHPPLAVLMQKNDAFSLHHERMAVLGNELSILGSANFGAIGTLNVLEVLRSQAAARLLRDELATSDEPYLVSRTHAWTPEQLRYKDCEFTFERDLVTPRSYREKIFNRSEIKRELLARYSAALSDQSTIVVPSSIPDDTSPLASIVEIGTRSLPIAETIKSNASYFCVEDPAWTTTKVVGVREAGPRKEITRR